MANTYTESELEEYISEAIVEHARECGEPEPTIETFREAGLMTSNKGLVLEVGGAVFQITIVRAR